MKYSKEDLLEFEGIDEKPIEEKTLYLLNLVSRYNDVVTIAKEILNTECLDEITSKNMSVPGACIKSKTTTKLDMNMLITAYPEVYKRLFEEGKLVAKAVDLRDFDDDVVENVISESKSTWLELEKQKA